MSSLDLKVEGSGFVRLYILCRAREGPISDRAIAEMLAQRGLPVSAGSLSQVVRGLNNSGYLRHIPDHCSPGLAAPRCAAASRGAGRQ
jgi:hypothetical protein